MESFPVTSLTVHSVYTYFKYSLELVPVRPWKVQILDLDQAHYRLDLRSVCPLVLTVLIYILCQTGLEMMLASLTYLMYTVSPKDLPCHINVHRTTFDGYNDNTLSDTDSINSDVSSGISISDLNARTGQHSGKFWHFFSRNGFF